MPRGYTWKVVVIVAVVAFGLVVFFGRLASGARSEGLKGALQKVVRLGLDLQGGSEIRYRVDETKVPASERAHLTEKVVEIVTRRIDPAGTLEHRINIVGPYQFVIQLPGADREVTERVRRLAEQPGRLEFRLVLEDKGDGVRLYDAAERGKTPAGYLRYPCPTEINPRGFVLVEKEQRNTVSGEYLRSVREGFDEYGRIAVAFEMTARGKRRFADITGRNIGRRLAIILNDRVKSAPEIKERIYGRGIISGRFTRQEVNELIAVLNAGSLPTDLIFDSLQYVGPTLGADLIRKGITASLVAAVIVVIFMMGYYFFAGFLADIALFINILLLLSVMSLARAHWSLSLPGIAGIALTLGMAVDANILIFERIREEAAKGRLVALAVRNGYERALSVIFDSNFTTIVTAFILALFGSGPVRGFGITLSIGLVINLFTAIFVTRVIFDILIAEGTVKRIRMLQLLKGTNFRFSKLAPFFIGFSILLIVVTFGFFLKRGRENLDIDFLGGVAFQMRMKEPVPIAEVRSRLAKAGFENVEVQSRVSDPHLVGKGLSDEFGIRLQAPAGESELTEDQMEEIANGLVEALSDIIPYKGISAEITDSRRIGSEGSLLEVSVSLEADLKKEMVEKRLRNIEGLKVEKITFPAGTSSDVVSRFSLRVRGTSEEKLQEALNRAFQIPDTFTMEERIGPVVSRELGGRARRAILWSLVVMFLYLAFRFRGLRYGMGAVVALAHDVAITCGLIAVADWAGKFPWAKVLMLGDMKFNLPMIAGLLTVVGYSVNDTIVVFDRIRENLLGKTSISAELVDKSINQTLGRTILTSLTSLFVVTVLYCFGGQRIHGFAFAMMVGVVVGTYSSIFIASPILLVGKKRRPSKG